MSGADGTTTTITDGAGITTGTIMDIITTGQYTTPITIITTIILQQEIHRTATVQEGDPEIIHLHLQVMFHEGNQPVQVLQGVM